MPRSQRMNFLQPGFNSPLVHLSGATAQQELSEAVNDTTYISDFHVAENDTTETDEHTQIRYVARNRRRRYRERLANARVRLFSGLLACRQVILCKWLVEVLYDQGLYGAMAQIAVCILVFFAYSLAECSRDTSHGLSGWFNAALTARIACFVASGWLDGSLRALVVAALASSAAVAWSSRANSMVHHFVIVFFEIVVLVQSGNFSSVDA